MKLLEPDTEKMRAKRTPSIEIRLAPTDWMQFDLACRMNGKNRTEMARKAIQFFLEHQNKAAEDKQESALEQRLKKMEDRLAGLMAKSVYDSNKRLDSLTERLSKLVARTALDTGCTFMLMFRLLNRETRDQVVEWASRGSFERLRTKLKHPETNVHQLMQWLEEEPDNAANSSKA